MRTRKAAALEGVELNTDGERYLMSARRNGRKVAGLMLTDDGNWIAAWYRSRGVSGRAVGPTPGDALDRALENALHMDYQEHEIGPAPTPVHLARPSLEVDEVFCT